MDLATALIFLQQGIISGLVSGSVYALLAISAVIIFKATDIPNFAQGEFMTVGAFLSLILLIFAALPYYLVIPATAAVCFVLGVVVNALVMQPITKAKGTLVAMVIATLGISFIIKGAARYSGLANSPRTFPALFSTDAIFIGDSVLTGQDIAILVFAIVAMLVFFGFFNFTRQGRAMRAVAMNPRAAALVGINLARVRMTIWGTSALLSGLAAILIGPKLLLTPDMGIIAIVAFAGAIIGGFTNLPGAVIGGFVIGIVENLIGAFVSTNAIRVTPFLVIMLVLLIRPQGLLGGKAQVKKV